MSSLVKQKNKLPSSGKIHQFHGNSDAWNHQQGCESAYKERSRL